MYSDICVFWYLNAYMFGCFHVHRFRYHLRMKVNECCRNYICSDSLYQLLLTSGRQVGKGNMYSSVSLDKMFKKILPEAM